MGFGTLLGGENMKTEKSLMVSLLLGIAWAAAGCQSIDSTDVRTSGVYAEFSLTTQSATEAKVDATLWAGGALSNTYLALTGPDHLTAYLGSNAYPMQGHTAIYESYSAIIPYPATDTELRVAFERGPDNVSAPGSTVIMPALFALAPTAENPVLARQRCAGIDWAPFDPTQLVSWFVDGACVQLFGEDGADDPVRSRFQPERCRSRRRPGRMRNTIRFPDQCTATADVTKSRVGQVDPGFSGGTFTASQNRSTTFTSVP